VAKNDPSDREELPSEEEVTDSWSGEGPRAKRGQEFPGDGHEGETASSGHPQAKHPWLLLLGRAPLDRSEVCLRALKKTIEGGKQNRQKKNRRWKGCFCRAGFPDDRQFLKEKKEKIIDQRLNTHANFAP